MSDIVERLRSPSKGSPTWMDTMAEAADEIERLRAKAIIMDGAAILAREYRNRLETAEKDIDRLRAALTAARREERERCAVELEAYAREVKDHGALPVDPYEAAAQTLREAASGIRAMGDE